MSPEEIITKLRTICEQDPMRACALLRGVDHAIDEIDIDQILFNNEDNRDHQYIVRTKGGYIVEQCTSETPAEQRWDAEFTVYDLDATVDIEADLQEDVVQGTVLATVSAFGDFSRVDNDGELIDG